MVLSEPLDLSEPALIQSNTVTANYATDYDIKCNTAGE